MAASSACSARLELSTFRSLDDSSNHCALSLGSFENTHCALCLRDLRILPKCSFEMFEFLRSTVFSSRWSHGGVAEDFPFYWYRRQLKDVTSKMNSMKRVQQTDRKKHAQMLEEARRREEHINVDTDYLKVSPVGEDSL